MADYLKFVKENGFSIQNVPANEITEDICIAAVTDKPMAIRHIANPSEAVCKTALQKDPDVLDFIAVEMVKKYKLSDFAIIAALECLEKEKQQLQAEKDAADIEYLKDGGSLRNIENPSYEVCKFAVNDDDVYALEYVPEALKTAEICKIAVKEDGCALEWVPEELKTAEMCKMAVEQYVYALEYVPEALKTAEICKIAVKKDGCALEWVPEELKTAEMCKMAVEQYGQALYYVPEEFKTAELCKIAVEGWNGALELVPEHIKPLL